jgi:hypothetical protein
MTVFYDNEVAMLKRKIEEFRSSFAIIQGNPAISSSKKAYDELVKALTMLEGSMYGYPECCVELYVRKGPASRAMAYEEFLEKGREHFLCV